MDDKPNLDPMVVIATILGVFINPKVAAIVGPYALILLGALGGAALNIGNRKDPRTLAKTMLYLFAATVAGVISAVPASFWISSWNDKLEAQWLFVPVSAFIAYYTDRIPELFGSVFEAIKSFISNWASKDKSP